MKSSIDAKVRPLANASLEKTSLQGAARLYVSKDSLITLTNSLENGRHCVIERLPGQIQTAGTTPSPSIAKREASLWILPEKNLSPNVVMMTRSFQEASGFKIGDQVRISILENVPEAEEIVVQDVSEGGEPESAADLKYPPYWECSLSVSMGKCG